MIKQGEIKQDVVDFNEFLKEHFNADKFNLVGDIEREPGKDRYLREIIGFSLVYENSIAFRFEVKKGYVRSFNVEDTLRVPEILPRVLSFLDLYLCDECDEGDDRVDLDTLALSYTPEEILALYYRKPYSPEIKQYFIDDGKGGKITFDEPIKPKIPCTYNNLILVFGYRSFAAKFLSVAPATLDKWQVSGDIPEYVQELAYKLTDGHLNPRNIVDESCIIPYDRSTL